MLLKFDDSLNVMSSLLELVLENAARKCRVATESTIDRVCHWIFGAVLNVDTFVDTKPLQLMALLDHVSIAQEG